MGKTSRQTTKSTIELLEEAVHLLRLAPLGVLFTYYIGTLPFVLGFLYFWAEMSHSAFAAERCAPAALALSFLFIWMKSWQAVFASELRARLSGDSPPKWSLGRAAQVVAVQAALQPSALFVLPVALVIALPFGWAYAFYQNLTVLVGKDSIQECFTRAAKQAGLNQGQNHALLSIFFLFGLFCFLNLAICVLQVPALAKSFLGIETVFSQGGFEVMNTTFLAVVCALTFLCVDPLIKAAYLLRCFYGESLATGEDLKAELRQVSILSRSSVMALILFFSLTGTGWAQGHDGAQKPLAEATPASTTPQKPPPSISNPELSRSINQVIHRREFSWRLPREKTIVKEEDKNWLVRLVDSWREVVTEWAQNARDCLQAFFKWLSKMFPHRTPSNHGDDSSSGQRWMTSLQVLFFALILFAACTLAILFLRMWKRRNPGKIVVAEALQPAPDLSDENVVATQLPEDGWLKMARELAESGNLRLALRALYLASLAHLGERNLIGIAKFKSNRDYERELNRRARALPQLHGAFAENVTLFDRAWYGLHEVDKEILERFQNNLERIRAC